MKITVAKGDGVGEEIMNAVLEVFALARVPLEWELVEMGKQVALQGDKTGIPGAARESVEQTGVLFKGPMQTPQGSGYTSVSVTARKMWGAFANKRIYRQLPGVPCAKDWHDLDLTIIRENIEDTYAGIEHMQTHDVAQCRRIITRPGCEQVHRYAFEVASRKGAKRITCAHKANIMKLTDGLFLDTFYEVASDYPELRADDVMVDELAMRLVVDPQQLEVVVLPNLHGDILSDLAAGLVGGLAYAPSANIGDGICIFEAAHGPIAELAGRDLANPTALLLSGTMMLRHLGLMGHAAAIEAALEEVLHQMHRRPDLGHPIPVFRTSRCRELMSECIESFITDAEIIRPLAIEPRLEPVMRVSPAPQQTDLRGIDVFLESGLAPAAVAEQLHDLHRSLKLTMIANRGTQVWPTGSVHTDCVNQYQARFEAQTAVEQSVLTSLLSAVGERFALCGAEWLRTIDGRDAYSLAQGQS